MEVENHKKFGQVIFDPTKIKLIQLPKGSKSILGHEFYSQTENYPVMNANFLDFLFQNQELIPAEWKHGERKGQFRTVIFMGTKYHSKSKLYPTLYVRTLDWEIQPWSDIFRWKMEYFSLDHYVSDYIVCPIYEN